MKTGEILVHSIGCGCDTFYQVVKATKKFVVAKKLEEKTVRHNVKLQQWDTVPIKDKFSKPNMQHKYLGGYREGKERYKIVDKNTVKLKIADDGHIGPLKRMIWWNVWDGKRLNQYSS